MTDNEIIKYWNEIDSEIINEHVEEFDVYITMPVAKSTVDLINRQNAEIERLEKKANTPFAKFTFDENKLKEIVADAIGNIEFNLNSVKSEAIKEFAERLKEDCYTYSDISGYQSTVVDVNQIDILVKELLEVQE